MSVVPQIFFGLEGNKDATTIKNMPTFGYSNNGLTSPDLDLNWKKTKKVENNTSLRQSVLLTNQGGSRGVKICKGNAVAGPAGSRNLRRGTIPYQSALYPHTGIARHQKKGLAYDKDKPINQPLTPLADCFNAGLNSRIPQPK